MSWHGQFRLLVLWSKSVQLVETKLYFGLGNILSRRPHKTSDKLLQRRWNWNVTNSEGAMNEKTWPWRWAALVIYDTAGKLGSKCDYIFDYDDDDVFDDDDDDNFLSQEGGMTLVANCVTVAIKSRLFFPLGKAES